ncbi:MAG: hypothetical protein M3Y08_18375, partial [Fibrobacterota bacterium]|nr:hypothetical protein [Fibrobacterota bacterium]
MNIRKDQPLSDTYRIPPDSTSTRPETAVNIGVTVDPQKTHATLAEGPVFNFVAAVVVAAEEALREVAADLKVSLEVLAAGCDGEAGYRSLQSELQERMPDLYRKYDAYVSAVLGTGEEKPACSKG